MYNPSHFEEKRTDVMHAVVRAHPLATLVVVTPEGLVANHIPLLLRFDGTQFGTLCGHIARANPLWKIADPSIAALVIFQGPQQYISPQWYATKQEHGKVVPTWNYVVVHGKGSLVIHDDAQWVRQLLQDLTEQQEAVMPAPWTVDDAPRDYTDSMIKALVGIEIPLQSLTGKWKVSQNQPAVNRQSLVQALQGSGNEDAAAMAQQVLERGQGSLHAP